MLVIDEVQKAAGWSESVKRLWDEDTRAGRRLRVVLLGSAPLLVEQGLSESLAGRFEVIRVPHWSLAEMRAAFGISLDEYVFFGGYPGAAPLIGDEARWRRYILDALIETTISRDVLLLTRVDKPALLRRLFELGCRYSGPGAQLHQDAGPAPRRRATRRPSPTTSSCSRGPACSRACPSSRATSIRRRALEPQAPGPQHGARDRAVRPLVRRRAGGPRDLGPPRGVGGRRAPRQRRGDRRARALVVARGGPRGRLRAVGGRRPRRDRGQERAGSAPRSRGSPRSRPRSPGLGPIRPLLVGGDGIALERFLLEPAERWVAR